MAVTVISGDGNPSQSRVKPVGLEAAVGDRGEEFPYLARALVNAKPAFNPKVEWLMDWGKERPAWFNWTQIFRTPFGMSNTQRAVRSYGGKNPWEALADRMMGNHLAAIEQSLEHGRLFRQINYHQDEETGEWYPVETRGMGGAKFYLKRDLNPEDYLSLRILRDCVFLDRTTPDLDGRSGEFLSEVSLEVCPGIVAAAA
jgi:hypothetical protein